MAEKKTGAAGRAKKGAAAPKAKAAAPLYAFRIELREIKPKIWRRFYCPSDITLDEFHDVIAGVMGWHGGHLHSFTIGGEEFYEDDDSLFSPCEDFFHNLHRSGLLAGLAGLDDFDGGGRGRRKSRKSPGAVPLRKLGLAVNQRFRYTYDFGDNWEHDLRVMSLDYQPKEPGRRYGCFAGERACPPEDCGSVPGYYRILAVLGQPGETDEPFEPDEDEDESLLEWLGGYNPDHFSLEEINARLP